MVLIKKLSDVHTGDTFTIDHPEQYSKYIIAIPFYGSIQGVDGTTTLNEGEEITQLNNCQIKYFDAASAPTTYYDSLHQLNVCTVNVGNGRAYESYTFYWIPSGAIYVVESNLYSSTAVWIGVK